MTQTEGMSRENPPTAAYGCRSDFVKPGSFWEYAVTPKFEHISLMHVLEIGLSEAWCNVTTHDGREFRAAYPLFEFEGPRYRQVKP